jgi:hypothetical protein
MGPAATPTGRKRTLTRPAIAARGRRRHGMGRTHRKEHRMKLVAQLFAALALVAYATPALPCPGHQKQQTTASNQADGSQAGKQGPEAKKSEKADKEKIAKSQKAKAEQRAAATN